MYGISEAMKELKLMIKEAFGFSARRAREQLFVENPPPELGHESPYDNIGRK